LSVTLMFGTFTLSLVSTSVKASLFKI